MRQMVVACHHLLWAEAKMLSAVKNPLSHLWERVPEGRERVWPKPLNLDAKQKQLNARSKAFAPASLRSELLFFTCAKKSNQKKAHPAFAPRPLRGRGSLRQRGVSGFFPLAPPLRKGTRKAENNSNGKNNGKQLPVRELSPHTTIPILHSGGIIAYPTEAVWGLGCDPANEQAVMRLLALKQRPIEKGLILVADDFAQLDGWAQLETLPAECRQAVLDTWPGPQTWILPADERAPRWITGAHPGIAVRVSAHPVVRALCRVFASPLVSTSANLSGQPPPHQYQDIDSRLLAQVDVVIKGRTGDLPQPTPVCDAFTGRILR